MNTSTPKPKASSTASGKKFCACSWASKTAFPPSLDHKHLMWYMLLAWGLESWTFCMVFLFATQTNPHILVYTHKCTHSHITSFFSQLLWCIGSKYSLMSLLRPICLLSCFQFPFSFSPLYPWWHYHLLVVPEEPLRNHESGCNVPFNMNTNVGVIAALPTGKNQSASSRAHYRPLLPYPHLSVFIPSSEAHIEQSPSVSVGTDPDMSCVYCKKDT